jgi:phytoene synthase
MLLADRVRPEDADLTRAAALAELGEARTVERGLIPVGAFPAVAQATLADAYLRGRRPSELAKRMRITWAVARGRI